MSISSASKNSEVVQFKNKGIEYKIPVAQSRLEFMQLFSDIIRPWTLEKRSHGVLTEFYFDFPPESKAPTTKRSNKKVRVPQSLVKLTSQVKEHTLTRQRNPGTSIPKYSYIHF